MPILGGLFARNGGGSSATSKSKSASDLHASSSQSLSPSNNTSTPSSNQPSPTGEYVSFTSGPGPSSPNGRGLAYAGEQKEKRGLFGRKRSVNALEPSVGQQTLGEFAFEHPQGQGQPRPAYLGRLSTSSDLAPAGSSLRPPLGMGSAWGTSTRSLPPASPASSMSLSPFQNNPGSNSYSYSAASNLAGHVGSPLAPSISPTKSTMSGRTATTDKTSKTSKSTGAKAGRRFFSGWGRKSGGTSPVPPSPSRPTQDDRGDFNLRAFRHVNGSRDNLSATPPSPSARHHPNNINNAGRGAGGGGPAKLTATNLSALEGAGDGDIVAPRRPRPRGTSDASASNSRISVAAFREAQARRVGAGSPAPGDSPGGVRSPSPGPGVYSRAPSPGPYNSGMAGSGSRSGIHLQGQQQYQQYQQQQQSQMQQVQQHHPQQQPQLQQAQRPPAKTHASAPAPAPAKKKSGHMRERNQWDSDEDEEEEEEEESESEAQSGAGPVRKRTITRAARSEAGHGGKGQVYGAGIAGSVSTGNISADVGAAASKRLSQQLPALQIPTRQQSAPPSAPPPQRQAAPPRRPTSSSQSDSDSDDSVDSDDAPLATLVAPRRPGSALSSRSNLNLSAGGSQTNLSPGGSNANLHAAGSHSNLHQSSLPPFAPSPSRPTHKTSGSASGSSVTSSRGAPGKPKPLIDIAALTAARPTLFGQPKEDGFTGGGMLASVSPSSNLAKSESPVLTSRSPPISNTGLVQFPSPPGSPVAEAPPALRMLSSMSPSPTPSTALRSSPMRRETAGSAVSLGAPMTRSTSPVGGGRRDVLSERLRAVAAANNVERERKLHVGQKTPEKPQHLAPPAAYANVAARKAFHRRSSSDIISRQPPAWDENDADKDGDGALGRDLADMLGGGIALVSRNGEMGSPPRAKSMDLDAVLAEQARQERPKDTIAPIVIKQRSPPPSFSVTSRPAHHQARSVSDLAGNVRQRSSTLVPVSTTSASGSSSFGGSNRSGSNSQSPSVAPSSTSGSAAHDNARLGSTPAATTTSPTPMRARQRSSTMMPLGTTPVTVAPAPVAAPTAPPSMLANPSHHPPTRPFAAPRMQRNSPASSTGDSSSGPAPLTPRDGSDFGSNSARGSNSGSGGREERDGGTAAWSGGVSGLVPVGAGGRRMHPNQRRSVSFDFEEDGVGIGDGKGKAKAKAKPRETPVQEEERRRERRRSEARAAIELGNVINGRGPIADEDDEGGVDSDDDVPINQQQRLNPMMSGANMNPMMGMNMPMGNMGNMGMGMPMNMGMNVPQMNMFGGSPGGMSPWGQSPPNMLSPAQFMLSPPTPGGPQDPNFYVAHQQAMLFAKQAYQMAVAQQAMAAAGDEWERGSSVGGIGGAAGRGSVYGGSVYGGGARSEYGGGGGSVVGSSYGGGGGMGMQGGWGAPSMLFPPAPRSMYGGGGSGARSEYGGGGGGSGGNWNSSRSVYGETFGPSTERYTPPRSVSGNLTAPQGQGKPRGDSGYFPPQGQSARPGPGGGNSGSPRPRTASQPATPSKGARRPPPPSSWKAAP
ncbi:hypothetical protein DFH06DRAFT_1447534 [Mycena polygramma]|nr:hypothetical protein DFH06DRAFT_1447534 [Mycena polygramma]